MRYFSLIEKKNYKWNRMTSAPQSECRQLGEKISSPPSFQRFICNPAARDGRRLQMELMTIQANFLLAGSSTPADVQQAAAGGGTLGASAPALRSPLKVSQIQTAAQPCSITVGHQEGGREKKAFSVRGWDEDCVRPLIHWSIRLSIHFLNFTSKENPCWAPKRQPHTKSMSSLTEELHTWTQFVKGKNIWSYL